MAVMQVLASMTINNKRIAEYFVDFRSSNKMVAAIDTRLTNGTLHYKDADYYYLPIISFECKALNPVQYSELIQMINAMDFDCYYWDKDIMQYVTRRMKLTQESSENLYNNGDIEYIDGFVFDCVCVRGYDDYAQIKDVNQPLER